MKELKQVDLIAIDMDGTLLDNEGNVSEQNKQAIQKAKNLGIDVVLSTGRPFQFSYDYAKSLGLDTYLIAVNGAQIWSMDQELLTQVTFSSEQAKSLWEFGNKHHIYMWMVAAEEMFRHSSRPKDFSDFQWIKVGFGKLTETSYHAVLDHLASYSDLEVSSSSESNIEVNALGVNKAAALKYLCELSQINIQNTVSIGDNLNDLKMIEAAGFGVAMGNSRKEVKDKADYITLKNTENGVAYVIEKILQRQDLRE